MEKVINSESAPEYRDWHKNWLVTDGKKYRAYEPDNTCIYHGTNLNDACKALNNSTFGEL